MKPAISNINDSFYASWESRGGAAKDFPRGERSGLRDSDLVVCGE